MMMNYKFEVFGNCGGALFLTEEDAISTLWLLGQYHDLDIDKNIVKRALKKDGYYEAFPLVIKAIS
ncbi:MAG: hypothetical protein IKC46_04105 [Lachnospiraceae bacterium]|nr:hypothetical protein [Lachnospiraceae bacterium]